MVEHSADNGKVTGSIPVIRTTPVEHGVRPTLIRLVWVDRYHLLVPNAPMAERSNAKDCKSLQSSVRIRLGAPFLKEVYYD